MSPGVLLATGQAASPDLAKVLDASPYDFLTPSYDLHTAALALAKQYLDPLASSTSRLQEHRVEAARRKRKRGRRDGSETDRSALHLKEVYLDGFTIDGVWGQARRVLDASTTEVERSLYERSARAVDVDDEGKYLSTARSDEDGSEVGHINDTQNVNANAKGAGEDEVLGDEEHEAIDGVEDDGASCEEEGDVGGAVEGDADDEVDPEDNFDMDNDGSGGPGKSSRFVKDKYGLNDGFFDIDEFNRDTEFIEQADARGDDEGAASDEEDVDWNADPTAQMQSALAGKDTKKFSRMQDRGGSDDEEGGPTFGNADLAAPWSDDDDQGIVQEGLEMDDGGMDNVNEIRYEDFFEPPRRSLTKTKRMRALPKTQPDTEPVKPTEEDMQRTIDSVRRDLFEDEFSDPDTSPDEAHDQDAPDTRNLSTHEKRRLTLAKQIRELEAASIAKREWQLSGEATAHARPENALLEEDLEFERAGKPVPIITADVTASIEDMIKQRILNRQFDEVIRRRPSTGVGSTPGQGQPRRGLMELSDQKDPQSLAESYEQAYLAQTDPDAKDPRSEALKVQHTEIETLWADVSSKLDALTSWRYKPKPVGVEVRVITDAPKVLLEDARPSGFEGVSNEQAGLAPQEVFRVGAEKKNIEEGIVTTKGGGVVAKEELTKEQRLRRRRREKERIKKRQATASTKATPAKADAVPQAKKRDDRSEILKQLKAGGVKVIGKGGEVRDVEGQKVKQTKGNGSAGAFKL